MQRVHSELTWRACRQRFRTIKGTVAAIFNAAVQAAFEVADEAAWGADGVLCRVWVMVFFLFFERFFRPAA